jgi:hypothetical protein
MPVPLPRPCCGRRDDPERKQRRLRRRFAKVTARLERRDRLRRMVPSVAAVGRPLLVVGLIAGAGAAALIVTSPWPLGLTLRHLASAAGCPVAQAVGLAPARRGEPGWWTRLDPDLDGWSCGSPPGGRTRGFWVMW